MRARTPNGLHHKILKYKLLDTILDPRMAQKIPRNGTRRRNQFLRTTSRRRSYHEKFYQYCTYTNLLLIQKKKKNVSPPIVSFTLQTLVKTYIFRIKKRKERKKERNLRFLLQNKINNCEKMERWKFTYEIRYRYLFNEIITENFAENLAARLHPRISTSGTLFPFKYNPEANEITLGWPPPVRLANSATHLPSKKRFNKFERHDSI